MNSKVQVRFSKTWFCNAYAPRTVRGIAICSLMLLPTGVATAGDSWPCRGHVASRSSGVGDHMASKAWDCHNTGAHADIDDLWRRFDFDRPDWDQGFGFYDRCGWGLPLKRMFDSLMLMKYSGGWWTCKNSEPNFLNRAFCWAGNAIDEVDARCGDDDYYAQTARGWDDRTMFYASFFTDLSTTQRAAMIVHEARHAEAGCSHIHCDNGMECDQRYFNSCHGGMGAYGLQIHWLAHYIWHARPTWRQDRAIWRDIDHVNALLRTRFREKPCFYLDRPSGRVIVKQDCG